MRKLVGIQALRAAAALSVALLHAVYERGLLAKTGDLGWIDRLPWEAGVDVFFVISGFVMVTASGRLCGAPGAWRRFLAHRVARIVPLYWCVTTLYLLLARLRPDLVGAAVSGPSYVLASYAFWPAARPDGTAVPLFSLGWTLNYEMFFYAVFALAVGAPARVAVAVVTAVLAVTVLSAAAGAPLPVSFWGGSIVLEFAFGMMLGLLRLRDVTLPPGLRIASIALGIGLLAVQHTGPDALRALAFGLPALCLVAGAGLGRVGTAGGEPRLIRALVLMGDASYALYLTHPFAIRGLRGIWPAMVPDVAPDMAPDVAAPIFVPVALALAVALSICVHLVVERPLTRTARRWLEPKEPREPKEPKEPRPA